MKKRTGRIGKFGPSCEEIERGLVAGMVAQLSLELPFRVAQLSEIRKRLRRAKAILARQRKSCEHISDA